MMTPTHADVPEAMRPPRAWPLLVFTVAALALALAALYLAWGASGKATVTQHASDRVARIAEHEREIRCARQRVRIQLDPTSPVEVALREIALDTYPRDCVR